MQIPRETGFWVGNEGGKLGWLDWGLGGAGSERAEESFLGKTREIEGGRG